MDAEALRSFCTALPATTEDVKWENDLVFSVGGKMYCVASLVPPFTVSFKVPDESFEALSVRAGFCPAPYLARAKWVQVQKDSILSKKEWEGFVATSYELVKAKLTQKMRDALGLP